MNPDVSCNNWLVQYVSYYCVSIRVGSKDLKRKMQKIKNRIARRDLRCKPKLNLKLQLRQSFCHPCRMECESLACSFSATIITKVKFELKLIA